jgi:hypothetical protein
MGNPFLDSSGDLYTLNDKDVAEDEIVKTVQTIQKLGQDQYEALVTERFTERTKSIGIKRNKLNLFGRPPIKEKSRTDFQLATLKSDCSLFSRLYISCQSRTGNMGEFIAPENQAYQPGRNKVMYQV